jgi:hypothetical protein
MATVGVCRNCTVWQPEQKQWGESFALRDAEGNSFSVKADHNWVIRLSSGKLAALGWSRAEEFAKVEGGAQMATDAFTRFHWVRADRPIELKIKHRNFRLIWVQQRDASPADIFPDQPATLQELAGDWRSPGEQGRSGLQIVGDQWEKPFVHDEDVQTCGSRDDPYRPARPIGTEVAIVFELDESTKLERIDLRMRDVGVRGPDTREPIQLKLVAVDDNGLPTDRAMIDPRSFTWQWVDTNWHNAHYDLKRSRLLPAGRYAAVLFKTPEEHGEYYHAEIPTFPINDDGEYFATRIVPGGTWRRVEATTAFGVFGCTGL